MSDRDSYNHLEEDISIHIFTVSAAMVGVCMTVIGLIRVVITLGKIDTMTNAGSSRQIQRSAFGRLVILWGTRDAVIPGYGITPDG